MNGKIEVRRLDDGELSAWDALVSDSVQGTVFHTSDWLLRTAASLNQNPIILGCYEDEELIGGCSLLQPKQYKWLKVTSSIAMLTPYGGVVVGSIESTKRRELELQNNKVIAAIQEYLTQQRFDYVNLINSPGLQDIRPFTQNGWNSKVYYTYILPINENLFDKISKNARRSIRKAQKLGIDVMQHFDPELYWELTTDTFRKHKSPPPFSKEHLVSMLNMIRDKNIGEMWIAKTSSEEIAAAEIILKDTKNIYRWSAASLKEHLGSGAVSLLLWEIFNDIRDRDYTSINLMAGNTAHLSTFIASYNPDLVPYYGVELQRIKYRILKGLKSILS